MTLWQGNYDSHFNHQTQRPSVHLNRLNGPTMSPSGFENGTSGLVEWTGTTNVFPGASEYSDVVVLGSGVTDPTVACLFETGNYDAISFSTVDFS